MATSGQFSKAKNVIYITSFYCYISKLRHRVEDSIVFLLN